MLTLVANQFTKKEGRKEMFYLTTHSTHFIYGYMASNLQRTAVIVNTNDVKLLFRLR